MYKNLGAQRIKCKNNCKFMNIKVRTIFLNFRWGLYKQNIWNSKERSISGVIKKYWHSGIQVFISEGFSGSSDGKESACNAGDLGLIPGLGRSPEGGHDSPLYYSCLENPHGQRSLVGYSPWGRKESDTTKRLSTIVISDGADWKYLTDKDLRSL